MPPEGLTILDLSRTINKYCELSPDRYARAHYDAMLTDLDDNWNTVPASWDWLKARLISDRQPLRNITDGDAIGY